MNDDPQETPTSDSFEELLQSALQARASSRPRDGITLRVLAHVGAENISRQSQLSRRWMIGTILTIPLVAVTLQTIPPETPTAPKAVVTLPTPPSIFAHRSTDTSGLQRSLSHPPAECELAGIKQSSVTPHVETRGEQSDSRGALVQTVSETVRPRLNTFPSHEQSQDLAFGTGPALNLPPPSPQVAEQIQLLRAEQALPLTIARLQIEPLSLSSGEKQ